jgi:transposase
MFLRKMRRRKDGKVHTYWALVESVRTARGPRQRVVAHLGELSPGRRVGFQRLGQELEGRDRAGQLVLYGDNPLPEWVRVDASRVAVERVLSFGAVWLLWEEWRLLGLADFFRQQLRVGKEQIGWGDLLAYRVVAQVAAPSSELAVVERFVGSTALADLLGIDEERIDDNRLLRLLDQVLPLRLALGSHLKQRYGELFREDFELLLYDMTSTFFEGECQRNPQAERGYSRDHRPDCKQVTLALVMSPRGLPLFYEVFDGSRADVTTVEEVVEAMEQRYGKAQRIWVMDRGMVSEANLEWLRQRGAQYLVGTPKGMLRKFEKPLLEKDWREVEAGIEVKLCALADGSSTDTFILCRSRARIEKEKAILERFLVRVEAGLAKIAQALQQGTLKDSGKAERRIGRLLGKNTRAERHFEVEMKSTEAGPRLTWQRRTVQDQWAQHSQGCYLLRTNLTGHSPEQLWKTYIQLTQVEAAFRVTKNELGLRPVGHQKQDRVQAHIFICYLGLVVWKSMELRLAEHGLGNSPRKVLEEFAKWTSMDVLLPTDTGHQLRLRLISQPDQALGILLREMSLKAPKRFRPQPDRFYHQNSQNVVETSA